jgi:hypothetical protein
LTAKFKEWMSDVFLMVNELPGPVSVRSVTSVSMPLPESSVSDAVGAKSFNLTVNEINSKKT